MLIFPAALPIALWLLPADFFDQGIVICPLRRFFNIPCLTCGTTRAIMHLIHFEWQHAWHFNKLSFLIAPILGYIWLKWTVRAAQRISSSG